MRVEFAWVGGEGKVEFRSLELPDGATLGEALAAIAEPALRRALSAGRLSAAVFGQVRSPGDRLFDGDRIELLEGLRVDPKLARQRRVAVRRAQTAREKEGAKGRRQGT
jgi:putative ubiquitin-RnfH superfamily antitoxin RatB of RatAB toxin-antitoxin module